MKAKKTKDKDKTNFDRMHESISGIRKPAVRPTTMFDSKLKIIEKDRRKGRKNIKDWQ